MKRRVDARKLAPRRLALYRLAAFAHLSARARFMSLAGMLDAAAHLNVAKIH